MRPRSVRVAALPADPIACTTACVLRRGAQLSAVCVLRAPSFASTALAMCKRGFLDKATAEKVSLDSNEDAGPALRALLPPELIAQLPAELVRSTPSTPEASPPRTRW